MKICIIFLVLLIFGANRLRGLAKGFGQGIREFKGAVDGVKDELKDVKSLFSQPNVPPASDRKKKNS